MRHYIILLICLLTASAAGSATMTDENASAFFTKAGIIDSTLILTGKPSFAAAGKSIRTDAVNRMLSLSDTRRAIVNTPGKTWIWYHHDGRLLCDEWSTAGNLLDEYNYIQVDRLGSDKWFFTVGGELSFSSVTTIGINGRVGTYLWQRFLDAGLGMNAGYSNGGGVNDWDLAVNLTSRLYFTRFFSRYRLSPFVGVGLGYVFCPEMSFDPLGAAGFNWYLPKGSIDFSMQYGKSSKFGICAGYTISF